MQYSDLMKLCGTPYILLDHPYVYDNKLSSYVHFI